MSILAKAQNAASAKASHYIKALLIGESKSGKTESAATLPLFEEKPLLCIALTPRSRATLAGRKDIVLLELFEDEAKMTSKPGSNEFSIVAKAWDDIYNAAIELWTLAKSKSGEAFPYSGIIFDDLSAANRFSMNHVLGLRTKDGKDTAKNIGGGPTELHYVPQMMMMTQLIYTLLLPLPCHVVVCGHADIYEDKETKIVKYYPKIYGKLRTEVSSWFDEVYECVRETKKGETKFYWNTIGSGQKEFLGSTLNKQCKLFPSLVHVDLDESPRGFAKLLTLSAKGGESLTAKRA